MDKEKTVEALKKVATREAQADLETQFGNCQIYVYAGNDGKEHVALVYGQPVAGKPTLVRVHSECITGDSFFSNHCDCGQQLDEAFRRVSKTPGGTILYLKQEGRGIGLVNKIKAYAIQQSEGLDTYAANKALGLEEDAREFDIAAAMLYDLDITNVALLTNNPQKVEGLQKFGLEVVREGIQVEMADRSKVYVADKVKQHKHHSD